MKMSFFLIFASRSVVEIDRRFRGAVSITKAIIERLVSTILHGSKNHKTFIFDAAGP
jgi:hypothetical protein